MLLRQMFPSPIGVLYISIIHNRLTYTNCIEFPSPIGVLYISMKYASYYKSASRYLFPSPIGVLYISMVQQRVNRQHRRSVSVPYWGSLYFNNIQRFHYTKQSQVSVPYWGSLYFNGKKKYISVFRRCFRPLLGFFIFQSC